MTEARSGDAPRSLFRGVYALIDPDRVEPIAFTEALLRAGIRLVQVRAKNGIDGATLIAIVNRVRDAGGLALVNDDVRLARLADGVHLGQEDAAGLDLPALRRALRAGVIGLSCGTPAEARAADPAVVEATGLPCAAIGGIDANTIARVPETGCVMAAVMGALVCDDPEDAARTMIARWKSASA
jgi:thiamine monophosphate synthase